jgi:hypothetical protein
MEADKVHGEKWITDYLTNINEYLMEKCEIKLLEEHEEY